MFTSRFRAIMYTRNLERATWRETLRYAKNEQLCLVLVVIKEQLKSNYLFSMVDLLTAKYGNSIPSFKTGGKNLVRKSARHGSPEKEFKSYDKCVPHLIGSRS